MRQQFLKLTFSQEVRRPCRKCFCKQGTQSCYTTLTGWNSTCTLPSPLLFLPNQCYLNDWTKL